MTNDQERRPASGNGRKQASADIIGANSEIGRKLRQYYDEIVSEEVPDRFAQLLKDLDQAENTRDSK